MSFSKGTLLSRGMFEMDIMCLGRTNVTVKVALNDGSSKHGKVFLASVGCIWVVAIVLQGITL